jgi:hypothetical protein
MRRDVKQWVVAVMCGASAASCTGTIETPSGLIDGPGRPANTNGAPRADEGVETASTPIGSIEQAQFACKSPSARGRGRTEMRRQTKDELLSSMAAIVGPTIMGDAAVKLAASQIPDESSGDLVVEFQASQVEAHVQGLFDVTQAIAAAAVANDTTAMQVFGSCALAAEETCATKFLRETGQRVLSRPLTAARRDALLAAFVDEGRGLQGMKLLLAALLLAPEAVFHLETPRRECPTNESLVLKWNDPGATFKPLAGATATPLQTITQAGTYSWEIAADKLGAPYTELRLALGVTSADASPAIVEITVNGVVSATGTTVPPGDQQLALAVALPATASATVHVTLKNASSARAVRMRSLTLVPDADFGCTVASASEGRVLVDDWTVASRLSYALTGRGPDPTLLSAASAGSLRTAEQVRAHAERLLKLPGARSQLALLFDAWLDLRQLPDPETVIAKSAKMLAAGLANEARRELLDFVENVVLDTEGTLETLMTAEVGFPRSARMASIYGTEIAPKGESVSLPLGHRGLLLRVAPLLSGLSSTSPIVRGVFVRKNLMCADLPSPDFGVVSAREAALGESDPVEHTTREIMTEITSPAPCMGCHSLINPIGFSLEGFDPIGRPRVEEIAYDGNDVQVAAHPIDTYAENANMGAGGPDTLTNADDLVDALADSQALQSCFAKRLFSTAQLRPVVDADHCALAEVQNALRAGKPLREAWLAAVVNDDLFYKRAE